MLMLHSALDGPLLLLLLQASLSPELDPSKWARRVSPVNQCRLATSSPFYRRRPAVLPTSQASNASPHRQPAQPMLSWRPVMACCSSPSDFRAASTPQPTTPSWSGNPPLRRHEMRWGSCPHDCPLRVEGLLVDGSACWPRAPGQGRPCVRRGEVVGVTAQMSCRLAFFSGPWLSTPRPSCATARRNWRHEPGRFERTHTETATSMHHPGSALLRAADAAPGHDCPPPSDNCPPNQLQRTAAASHWGGPAESATPFQLPAHRGPAIGSASAGDD